ncbi:MAG TPA: hypothetical protein VL443_28615 [Cyclobacteriaceae bacterium]|jgi:CheY-like chemotaxis protein|nr:hypothetical protein [Cyclobacteriaceae bacterium]
MTTETQYSANQLSRDFMTTHHIKSYYQVARMIISRIREIESENKKSILVAGSEPQTISLISAFLESADLNYEVSKTNSYSEALDLAVSCSPDLIITDGFLLEVDKPDLIQQLKRHPVTMRIPVVITKDLMMYHNGWSVLQATNATTFLRSSMNYQKLKERVKEIFMSDTLKNSKNARGINHSMNQFIKSFVHAASTPVFCQDAEGRLLVCNTYFETLFNVRNSEVAGKFSDEFLSLPVAHALQVHFPTAINMGSTNHIEMEGENGSMQLILNYSAFEIESEIIILGIITDVTNMFETNHEKIKQEKEVLQSENEINKRELTMLHELLIHSRTTKLKLIEGVNKLQPFLNMEGKSKLFSLLRQLQWELNDETDLGVEKKFDQLHAELYLLLERKCPEITKNEKRLCAYLRMNHGASDISKITNKSLNSINVGFARLRTKLGLATNRDLRAYLNRLSTSS